MPNCPGLKCVNSYSDATDLPRDTTTTTAQQCDGQELLRDAGRGETGCQQDTAPLAADNEVVAPRLSRNSNIGLYAARVRGSMQVGPVAQGAQGVADGFGAHMFADADAMREKIHKDIDKKDYDVTAAYHDHGFAQAIARSSRFGTLTLVVICINAIWIGLDAECNDSTFEQQPIPGCPAQPGDKEFWQGGEHAFCSFFTFELLVRFGAFRKKMDAFRDHWFKFDGLLVFFMIFETWIAPLFFRGGSDSLGNASILRMLRLLRLTRMVRIMRSVSELVTLLKGMVIAGKSVSYTLLLLLIFMYIFSIIFKSQVDGSKAQKYFDSILQSMWTLLLHGCLLDDISIIADVLLEDNILLAAVFIIFVLLASLMVLNMLIGVLCAVVTAVAAAEKEKVLVNYVKTKLMGVLEKMDEDGNGLISKKEFDQLVNEPDAIKALNELGLDVPNLISLADHLFEVDELDVPKGSSPRDVRAKSTMEAPQEETAEKSMKFAEFMEMVIRLRAENSPSVADIVELRKLIFKGQRQVARRLHHIERGQTELQRSIRNVCEQLDLAFQLTMDFCNCPPANAKNVDANTHTSGNGEGAPANLSNGWRPIERGRWSGESRHKPCSESLDVS